jgi:phosphoribosylanthranilate isomerase
MDQVEQLKIKICGLTNLEDALAAAEAGADAVGFVFYQKSPRYIDSSAVRAIVRALPPFVLPVGVFVNESVETVRDTMDTCGLALAQLHGDESSAYCEQVGRPVLKALRVKDRISALSVAEYQGRAGVRGFVLDACSDQAYGGTGLLADWNVAAALAKTCQILLAGGLTPENVADAVTAVRPYGVDVSSGVESSPGKKDHGRLRAFVQAARLVSA